MRNVRLLVPGEYAIIDLDTGTITGTNVVLVAVPDNAEHWDAILGSDDAAIDYGMSRGIPVMSGE